MGPGKNESHISYFAKTLQEDYEKLCKLDVLGLQDHPMGDQNMVHEEFKESLQRNRDGSYITCLPWKPVHPPLKVMLLVSKLVWEDYLKRWRETRTLCDYSRSNQSRNR
jgi:hypothetical protein